MATVTRLGKVPLDGEMAVADGRLGFAAGFGEAKPLLSSTRRMPRPPPPARAFRAKGKPMASEANISFIEKIDLII